MRVKQNGKYEHVDVTLCHLTCHVENCTVCFQACFAQTFSLPDNTAVSHYTGCMDLRVIHIEEMFK